MVVSRIPAPLVSLSTAAIDFAKGVGDTAVDLYYFFPDLFRYVVGIDVHLGDGRRLDARQMARGLWRTFDWADPNPFSTTNPITGPVVRTVDAGMGMIYGAIDLAAAHYPHTFFNERLGWQIPCFSPPPQNARETGRDLSLAVFLGSLGQIRSGARQALRLQPKPKPVSEQPAFRQYARQMRNERRAARWGEWKKASEAWLNKLPKPIGAYSIVPMVEGLIRKVLDTAREEYAKRTPKPERNAEASIAWEKMVETLAMTMLAQEAPRNPLALAALRQIVNYTMPFEGAVQALVSVENKMAGPDFLTLARSARRNPNSTIRLVDLARSGEYRYAARAAVKDLPVEQIFQRAIRGDPMARVALIEAARTGNTGAQGALGHPGLLARGVEDLCRMQRAVRPLEVLDDLAGLRIHEAVRLLKERALRQERDAVAILDKHAGNANGLAADALVELSTENRQVRAVIALARLEQKPSGEQSTMQGIQTRTRAALERVGMEWLIDLARQDLAKADGQQVPLSLVALRELAKCRIKQAADGLARLCHPDTHAGLSLEALHIYHKILLATFAEAAIAEPMVVLPRFLDLAEQTHAAPILEMARRLNLKELNKDVDVDLHKARMADRLAQLGHSEASSLLQSRPTNRTLALVERGDPSGRAILEIMARHENEGAARDLLALRPLTGGRTIVPRFLRAGWENLQSRWAAWRAYTLRERFAARRVGADVSNLEVAARMRNRPIEELIQRAGPGANLLAVLQILSITGHKGAATALSELTRTGRSGRLRALPLPPASIRTVYYPTEATIEVATAMRNEPLTVLMEKMKGGASLLDVLRLLEEEGHVGARTALEQLVQTGLFGDFRAVPPPPAAMETVAFRGDLWGRRISASGGLGSSSGGPGGPGSFGGTPKQD